MKSFDDFRNHMSINALKIKDEIESKTDKYIDENKVDNIMTADKVYAEIAIMTVLEEYHNWLNS